MVDFVAQLFLPLTLICMCASYKQGGKSLIVKETDPSLLLRVGKFEELRAGGFTVKCTLENKGKSEANIFLSSFLNLKMIISSNGKEKELRPTVQPRIRISKELIKRVAPGEAYSFEYEIRKGFFVWPEPGVYEARVVYENKSSKVEGVRVWTGRVESNLIQVEFR